ncbi:hypothetical protein Tco_0949297 [Tanacetum coccineum]
MSLQEMGDLKRHYLDEMLSLSNDLQNKDYHNEIIDIRFRRECENMIDEFKGKYNEMSIEINKKKELRQIKQAAKLSTYTTEPSRHFNCTCYDDDDYEERSIPLNEIDSQIPPSFEITPVLPTLESEDSLILGDEHLSTIPEKESDELAYSLVRCEEFFFSWSLSKTVYMHQPPGFVDPQRPDYVCHLHPVICRTLMDTKSKLGVDGYPVSDPTLYWSLASVFQISSHLTRSLTFDNAVPLGLSLNALIPWEPHLAASKCILRYARGTVDHGLQLHVSSTSHLTAYTNDNWVGCPVTCRSASGYCAYLRTKNLEIDIHFIRDFVACRQVRVLHAPTRFQYVDIFTKGLTSA